MNLTVVLPAVLGVLLFVAVCALAWIVHVDQAMRTAVRDVIDGVETDEHQHDGKPCRSPGCARARRRIRLILSRRLFGPTRNT